MHIALNAMLLRAPHSGVEVSIRELIRHLGSHGRESYTVYVPADGDVDELVGPRVSIRQVRGVGRSRVARILWEQLALPPTVGRAGADLLHAPGYIAPVAARTPTVVTVHDIIARLHPELCRPANRWHYRLMLPLSVRKARRIIVPSTTTGRDIEQGLGIPADRIAVVPWGVGDEFRVIADRGELEEVRRRLRLPNGFILFVGNLEAKKNLVALVRAYHRLRTAGRTPCHLVLAGPPGWGGDDVRAEVGQLGLASDVHFPGFIDAADLPHLYNLADLFVFPSLYEGFGLPPLEAMACGTPVVASDRGALRECVGDAGALCDPTRLESLAEAMDEVLANRERRRQLVENGRRRAAGFTWPKAAAATEAVYREAGGAGAPDDG